MLGVAKVHYVSAKNDIDQWDNLTLVAPFALDNRLVDWSKGESMPDVFSLLTKEMPPQSSFREIPFGLKSSKDIEKSFQQYIYEERTHDLLSYPELKMTASPEETERDFRASVAQKLREQRDGDIALIREKYRAKLSSIQDKIAKAQIKLGKEQAQAHQNIFASIISFLSTLLGAFFGRGVTKGTLTQAGTAIRRAGRITKDNDSVNYAEESVDKLQQQQQELEDAQQNEINNLQQNVDPSTLDIKKIAIAAKKSDISIQSVALVWWPTR